MPASRNRGSQAVYVKYLQDYQPVFLHPVNESFLGGPSSGQVPRWEKRTVI